jgi:hypothetical protein
MIFNLNSKLTKDNLRETKGLDSSTVVASKILEKFGKKISSGLIRRLRRKYGITE